MVGEALLGNPALFHNVHAETKTDLNSATTASAPLVSASHSFKRVVRVGPQCAPEQTVRSAHATFRSPLPATDTKVEAPVSTLPPKEETESFPRHFLPLPDALALGVEYLKLCQTLASPPYSLTPPSLAIQLQHIKNLCRSYLDLPTVLDPVLLQTILAGAGALQSAADLLRIVEAARSYCGSGTILQATSAASAETALRLEL